MISNAPISQLYRKIAPMISTEVSVIVHGPADITMTFKGLVSITKRIPFNLEFEEKTPDGRNVKVFIIIQNNVL